MNRHHWLTLMLVAAPHLAAAGTLHRCVSGNGAVSIQSTACGQGQRLDRIITYVPEPDAAPARTGRPETRRSTATYTTGVARRGTGKAARQAADACRLARRQRDATLQRLGLRRTYDDLSRLDARVRAACAGY